jgi:hypothetical protein
MLVHKAFSHYHDLLNNCQEFRFKKLLAWGKMSDTSMLILSSFPFQPTFYFLKPELTTQPIILLGCYFFSSAGIVNVTGWKFYAPKYTILLQCDSEFSILIRFTCFLSIHSYLLTLSVLSGLLKKVCHL